MRKVGLKGKQKLVDKWEQEPYVVKQIPNSDIPVYRVQREVGKVPFAHFTVTCYYHLLLSHLRRLLVELATRLNPRNLLNYVDELDYYLIQNLPTTVILHRLVNYVILQRLRQRRIELCSIPLDLETVRDSGSDASIQHQDDVPDSASYESLEILELEARPQRIHKPPDRHGDWVQYQQIQNEVQLGQLSYSELFQFLVELYGAVVCTRNHVLSC